MEEIYEDLDCPVPEAFRDKLGVILSITWLFFLAFVTRVMFAPLIPAIEEDLRISPAQVGSLFLMMTLGALLASFFPAFSPSGSTIGGTLFCRPGWWRWF